MPGRTFVMKTEKVYKLGSSSSMINELTAKRLWNRSADILYRFVFEVNAKTLNASQIATAWDRAISDAKRYNSAKEEIDAAEKMFNGMIRAIVRDADFAHSVISARAGLKKTTDKTDEGWCHLLRRKAG